MNLKNDIKENLKNETNNMKLCLIYIPIFTIAMYLITIKFKIFSPMLFYVNAFCTVVLFITEMPTAYKLVLDYVNKDIIKLDMQLLGLWNLEKKRYFLYSVGLVYKNKKCVLYYEGSLEDFPYNNGDIIRITYLKRSKYIIGHELAQEKQ